MQPLPLGLRMCPSGSSPELTTGRSSSYWVFPSDRPCVCTNTWKWHLVFKVVISIKVTFVHNFRKANSTTRFLRNGGPASRPSQLPPLSPEETTFSALNVLPIFTPKIINKFLMLLFLEISISHSIYWPPVVDYEDFASPPTFPFPIFPTGFMTILLTTDLRKVLWSWRLLLCNFNPQTLRITVNTVFFSHGQTRQRINLFRFPLGALFPRLVCVLPWSGPWANRPGASLCLSGKLLVCLPHWGLHFLRFAPSSIPVYSPIFIKHIIQELFEKENIASKNVETFWVWKCLIDSSIRYRMLHWKNFSYITLEELFRGPAAFSVAVKKSDSESKRLQHAFFQPVSLSGALTHQLRSPWYSQAPASRLLWGKAGSSPGHASPGLCGPAFLGLGSSLSITIPHPRVTREALGHSGALNGRFL